MLKKEYVSILEAGASLGIKKPTQICGACKGNVKSAYGYQWSYEKKDNIGKVIYYGQANYIYKPVYHTQN